MTDTAPDPNTIPAGPIPATIGAALANPGAVQPPVIPPAANLVAASGSRFSVPGAIRRPHANISKSMIWLYGEPKIGKTTLAAGFPGVWFIGTERGQDWVTVREPTIVDSWDSFLELCAYIQETKPTVFGDGEPIETLCIDTVDGLFKMCFEAVCAGLGVEDPGELPHGKGWSRLSAEWERVMNKVRKWPYGLICISHVRSKEVKVKNVKRDRLEPHIGAAGARWCNSTADLILYAHARDVAEVGPNGTLTGRILEERVLQCQPASHVVAGGRMVRQLGIPSLIALDYNALSGYFKGTPPPEIDQHGLIGGN